MRNKKNIKVLSALLNKNRKFSDKIIYIEKRAKGIYLNHKKRCPKQFDFGGYKRRKVNEKYNLKLAGSSI